MQVSFFFSTFILFYFRSFTLTLNPVKAQFTVFIMLVGIIGMQNVQLLALCGHSDGKL